MYLYYITWTIINCYIRIFFILKSKKVCYDIIKVASIHTCISSRVANQKKENVIYSGRAEQVNWPHQLRLCSSSLSTARFRNASMPKIILFLQKATQRKELAHGCIPSNRLSKQLTYAYHFATSKPSKRASINTGSCKGKSIRTFILF